MLFLRKSNTSIPSYDDIHSFFADQTIISCTSHQFYEMIIATPSKFHSNLIFRSISGGHKCNRAKHSDSKRFSMSLEKTVNKYHLNTKQFGRVAITCKVSHIIYVASAIDKLFSLSDHRQYKINGK